MTEATKRNFRPTSVQELEKLVQWAAAERTPLEVIGSGSKRSWGRSMQAAHTLRLDGLSGIVEYEPEELVLTVKAGTPLTEVQQLLAQHNQELPFEPVDLSTILSQPPASGTIGGTLATNLSGPRRLKAGAARDHVLGLEAVSGRGEAFKAGGRVVKNVTGYDLARGFCGSWGTLALATSVTLKVLPRAAKECTLMMFGLTPQQATDAMAQAMGSSAEVSSAAYIPQSAIPLPSKTAATCLRLEGIPVSIAYRLDKLMQLLQPAKPEVLEDEASHDLWKDIGNLKLFEHSENPLWKISVTPTSGYRILEALEQHVHIKYQQDWAGGLLWIEMLEGDPHDVPLRRIIAENGGGHATLLRALPSIRDSIEVFQPQPEALMSLNRRLKHQFDPQSILNPGRIYANI